jgi:multiple sugar transport system permease protein
MFRFFSPVAIALPLYILYNAIGLYDSLQGLILVYVLLNIPFIVWLMRGYFMDVPKDLEEAYEVNGLSKTQIFFEITLPLVFKGLLVTALFCLIFTWNDFTYALILTGTNARTLPGQTVSSLQGGPGGTAAAAIMIAAPMIVFGLIIRRYLIRGLTLGAVR